MSLEFFGKGAVFLLGWLGCWDVKNVSLPLLGRNLSDKDGKQDQKMQKERLLIASFEDLDLASGYRYLKFSET